MARNLCTSSCCDNVVRMSDLRGKPIEFRRYHVFSPVMGTKWVCPTCETAYFAIWRSYDPSQMRGSYTAKINGRTEPVGCFVIDLSLYDSFNDEPIYDEDQRRKVLAGEEKPWHLCEEDCEEVQWVW